MSNNPTFLEQIRDHLQSVLDIMAAEYPSQLCNNKLIPALICDTWGEILDDTKPKDISVQTWVKEAPQTPSVDRQLLNEAYCEYQ